MSSDDYENEVQALARERRFEAEPSPAVPQAPNDQPKEFEFFRCLSCGFSGAITTEEVGNHRAQCAHGPTVAVDSVAAPAAQTVPIPEDLQRYDATLECSVTGAFVRYADVKEYLARAEDSKAYFAELHTKQYENMKAELARAEATIADERKISAKLSDAWGKLNEQLQNAEATIAELKGILLKIEMLAEGSELAGDKIPAVTTRTLLPLVRASRATGKES